MVSHGGVDDSEIFGFAECEIIHFVNCEISPFGRCEMKFAHIRVSEYFTFAEQIFHSEAISLAQRANFVEKSQVENRLGFFLGRGGRTRTRDPRFWRPVLYQLSYTPMHSYIISHTFCFCKSFFDFFLSFFLLIITFTSFLLLFAVFYAIILLINLFSEAFYEA